MMYQYGWGHFRIWPYWVKNDIKPNSFIHWYTENICEPLQTNCDKAVHDFWNIRYALGIMHMPLLFKDITFEDRSDPFHGCPTDDVTITPVRVEHPWMIDMSKIDVYTIKKMKHSATYACAIYWYVV